jgi:hypothetical protein
VSGVAGETGLFQKDIQTGPGQGVELEPEAAPVPRKVLFQLKELRGGIGKVGEAGERHGVVEPAEVVGDIQQGAKGAEVRDIAELLRVEAGMFIA